MKVLYLECNMGAAGDMLTASLYQLLSEEQKKQFLEKMNSLMPEVSVEAEVRTRCGINGTGICVKVHGEEEEAGHDPMHDHEHDHDPMHDHEHDHEHDHSHEHVHDHEHDHGHDYDHNHGHDHDHNHTHEHDHSHDHGHDYDHNHDHEHEHDHNHGHEHDHSHQHGEHDHHHTHIHRGMAEIMAYIGSFDLPETVKKQAAAVYGEIAKAESIAHGKPVDEIHFHEVGALDAVADVTGACYALHLLSPERVIVSPVNVGNGMVRAAHGILPVPAPATAEILRGVPSYMNPERIGELCTPTGAALLKTFADAFGAMPVMQVSDTGYGMGRKEFASVNCVRAFLGETEDTAGGPNQKIWELTVNVDDMTAEAMGFAIEQLLAEGALDVFAVPAVMKKNRPGHVITCLCRNENADHMAQQMLKYTTSFGVRRKQCDRYAMEVSFSEMETPYGIVTKKTGSGYGITKSKPEYEQAAKLARENGVSVVEVLAPIK